MFVSTLERSTYRFGVAGGSDLTQGEGRKDSQPDGGERGHPQEGEGGWDEQ